jgi:hypothetical protein
MGHGPEFAGADGTPDPDRYRFSHYQGCLSVSQGVGAWVVLLRKPSEIMRDQQMPYGTEKCTWHWGILCCCFSSLNLL